MPSMPSTGPTGLIGPTGVIGPTGPAEVISGFAPLDLVLDPIDSPGPDRSARPRPRRPRLRRSKLLVPVLTTVAVLVGGGVYGNQAWQDHQRAVQLQQRHEHLRAEYAAGHRAFLAGDCDRAVPRFEAASDPVLEPETSGKAGTERTACAKLTFTRTVQGGPGDRVVAFMDYLDTGPGAPLQPIAAREVFALFTSSPPDKLATSQLCDRLDDVGALVLDTAAERAKGLPPVLLRCADAARKAADLDTADDLYGRLRRDYAKSTEAQTATATLAKLIVAAGKKGKHFTLPPIPAGSRDRSLGKNARVVIYNGTPGELEIALSGAASALQSAGPCSSCKVYSTPTSGRCKLSGPNITVELPAGRYAVNLRFAGAPRSTISTWTLRAGSVYTDCYYAVKGA